MMTPGYAKPRSELPWLPYPESDRMYVINAHNFGGGTWTPANISTQLWIDFADQGSLYDATSGGSAVANGGGIARAEDKSGNARHFTQATSGARPTWRSASLNGRGLAEYDGGDWLTSISANSTWTFLHSEPSTIFATIKSGVTSNPNAFISWLGNNGGSSTNRGIYLAYDNRNLLTGLTNAFSTLASNTGGAPGQIWSSINTAGNAVITDFRNVLAANTYQVYSILCDPTNATLASRIKLGVNGAGLVGNNERNSSTSSNSPTFALQIGTVGNNAAPLLGDFCELIILNSLASTDTRQTIEGYLAHKWGLTSSLPIDHPYKSVAP